MEENEFAEQAREDYAAVKHLMRDKESKDALGRLYRLAMGAACNREECTDDAFSGWDWGVVTDTGNVVRGTGPMPRTYAKEGPRGPRGPRSIYIVAE